VLSPQTLLARRPMTLNMYGATPAFAGFWTDFRVPTANSYPWFMIELDEAYYIESLVVTAFTQK